MDLEQLNKIDTSNAEQVKALQTFLKTRGYYNGPVDGKWGGGTTEGTVKLRNDLTTAATTSRDTAVANQQANDPTNNAIRGATELAPYGIGAATGIGAGFLEAYGLRNFDKAKSAQVSAIAANPNISGEAANAQMRGIRSARNITTATQFLAPAALLGSAEYLRRGIAPSFEDPETHKDTETSRWIKLGANLDQGAGIGLGIHQLANLRNRIGSPYNAEDEALIASRPPGGTPPPPPPEAPALRTPSDRLISAAKAAGATGRLTKTSAAEYLANNVTDANRAAVATELGVGPGQRIATAVKRLATSRVASSIALPLTAGALAYGSGVTDAEAAGAEPGDARRQGLKEAAATTAGTTAGMYAASKLPPLLRAGGGLGMNMLAPFAASDMTDTFANYGKGFTPEEIQASQNRTLNTTARNTPAWMDTGPVRQAREMSQVPEPSPVRSVLSGYTAQLNGPLMRASALQVPENIPPNAAQEADAAAAGPSPARAAYGDDRFNQALQAFLGTIQEHNNSVGGGTAQ